MNQPRYQYSEFIKNPNRDGQIVVRADDWDIFLEDVKKAEAFGRAARQADAPVSPQNDVMESHRHEQARSYPDTPEEKACPQCNGGMWDNRPKKKDGTFKSNSPDFKCKDNNCGHVIWPPKE